MLCRVIVGLIAIVLAWPALSPQSIAQPAIEPGAGVPQSFAVQPVAADAKTVRFDDLLDKGRVRGIRLVATQAGCVIANVKITYSNGQVHNENRVIPLNIGERTAVIDPRFDDRRIELVEVVLRDRSCARATLELQGVIGPVVRTTRDVNKNVTRGVETAQPYTSVEIYYGTDRKPEKSRLRGGIEIGAYGGEPANRLELGKATVTIPKARKPGTIPVANVDLIITTLKYWQEDLARDFTMLGVEAMQPAAFVAAMKARLGQAQTFKGHAFVFIHGYFVTFDDAMFRAAQITYDMGFDGLPLVYSWPSAGQFRQYVTDRERAREARNYLKQFLDLVLARSGATQIHLIAHSTGAHALLEALDRMQLAPSAGAPVGHFGEIVFAAPDVLATDFTTAMSALKGMGRGTTLYASKSDRALQLSEFARNGLAAAGLVPANGIPVLVAGVDSVDVSGLNTSYFGIGHSIFGDALPLLQDMGKLFATGYHPPSVRDRSFQENAAPNAAGTFWRWAAQP